jgi:uncharacterized RDD family membrane protein YckC
MPALLNKKLELDRRATVELNRPAAPPPLPRRPLVDGPTFVGKRPAPRVDTVPEAVNPFVDGSEDPDSEDQGPTLIGRELASEEPEMPDAETDPAHQKQVLLGDEVPETRPILSAVRGRLAADDRDEEFENEGDVYAEPASLWRRAVAFIVDGCVIGGAGLLYLNAAQTLTGIGRNVETGGLTQLDAWVQRAHAMERIWIPGLALCALLALLYTAVFGFAWRGRTLGRTLAGIRLVDKRGRAPSALRAVFRAILSVFSVAFFLGGIWLALFDRRGQTLHDKLTSTFVIKPA